MIDERHILINGECMISVYCEDYGSRTSGGVAFLLIIPPTQHQQITHWHLGLIFNQGLSGTWHYFQECVILPDSSEPQTGKQMSYFPLTGFDGNISSCTSILDACEAMLFQAYVVMDAITPFWVQTLIETLCNFVSGHADNRTFCYSFLSWLMSNFFLNISWVSHSLNLGIVRTECCGRRRQELPPQILAKAFKVWHSQLRGAVQRPTNAECKYLPQKPALRLVWNCSRPFEDERERGGFLGRDRLGKASVNHSPGRTVGWREADEMAVAFCAHPGTQACSLFRPRQRCQQDKVLSYPPNQLP